MERQIESRGEGDEVCVRRSIGDGTEIIHKHLKDDVEGSAVRQWKWSSISRCFRKEAMIWEINCVVKNTMEHIPSCFSGSTEGGVIHTSPSVVS